MEAVRTMQQNHTTAPMKKVHVSVKLFARVREICGSEELAVTLPAGADAASCFDELAARHPRLGGLRDRLLVAVNEEYADWERSLAEGDVVSFIPPVSGG